MKRPSINWDKVPDRDEFKDKYTYSVLGKQISLAEMAESAFAMLEDDMAAESDPTACDHAVGLPYQGGYACGTCHKEITLDECREVWINLNNGVVKISGIMVMSDEVDEVFG